MSEQIRTGTDVRWSWGAGEASGTVTEVHHDRVERESKGSTHARNGSDENPAYVIEQDDGTVVLKLRSELERDD